MKVCIITIHFGVNHGSALQAFALTEYLNELGYDASIIDYIPERYNAWNSIKVKKYPLLVKLFYYLLTLPSRHFKRKIFEKFLFENVNLTKRYNNRDELISNPPNADVYIAGSDQIWNKEYNGEGEYSYFLPFVKDGKKRIAYAASFGRSKIFQKEKEEIMPYLRRFDHISVREDSGLNILEQCGIKNGVHVIDPTLLLTKERWRKLSSNNIIDDKYLLIYVMDHKYEKLIAYGEQIARRLNLKIYVVCFKKVKDKKIDVCLSNIGPKEFLNLFDNASYVVSNSYHGVIFSINFGKQFIAVAKDRYNARIESILKLMHLEDRFIYDEFNLEKAIETINYENVTIYLDKEREKSAKFLKESLKEAHRWAT